MKTQLKLLAFMIGLAIIFSSCSNYGKKVTFEGTKGEVYYKGDGVTETDAKKLGEYLKTLDYISNKKENSYQLTKKADTYVVKLVIDRPVYDTIKNIDASYKALGVLISKSVFNNQKVDISLSNDVFEEFKHLSYDEAYAKLLDAEDPDGYGKDVFIAGTKGEVFVKGDGVTEAEAQKLGEHLKQIDFMNNENPTSVQLIKNNDAYLVRFVYDKQFYDTTPDIVQKFNIIRNSISQNVFSGQKVDIRVANNKMEDFATVPYQ